MTDLITRLREKSRLGYWPLLGDEAADHIEHLLGMVAKLRAALESLAEPCRPDGTYKLSREACVALARVALETP